LIDGCEMTEEKGKKRTNQIFVGVCCSLDEGSLNSLHNPKDRRSILIFSCSTDRRRE
jgi:hypothetical protein